MGYEPREKKQKDEGCDVGGTKRGGGSEGFDEPRSVGRGERNAHDDAEQQGHGPREEAQCEGEASHDLDLGDEEDALRGKRDPEPLEEGDGVGGLGGFSVTSLVEGVAEDEARDESRKEAKGDEGPAKGGCQGS